MRRFIPQHAYLKQPTPKSEKRLLALLLWSLSKHIYLHRASAQVQDGV